MSSGSSLAPAVTCIVCGLNEAKKCGKTRADGNDFYEYDCPRCGQYYLEEELVLDDKSGFNKSNLEISILSGFLRECSENKRKFGLTYDLINEIIKNNSKPLIYEMGDKLIAYLNRKTSFFGEVIQINANIDYSISYCLNNQEFHSIIQLLIENQLVQRKNKQAEGDLHKLVLTAKGVAHANTKISSQSKKVFVAMSFNNQLNTLYENAIKPALEYLGYESVRIDEKITNGKICDAIISEIRSARFIVSDFTNQKQNVYFEAGFALGLGKTVVWMCEQEEIDQNKLHFDTRQYGHIVWEKANLEKAKQDLINRVKALNF